MFKNTEVSTELDISMPDKTNEINLSIKTVIIG